MNENLLVYAAPERRRRFSRLGMASIGIFVLWFSPVVAFGPLINAAPLILALVAEVTGAGLGFAAIYKTRGRAVTGWLGLLLNCLPAVLLFELWLWLTYGHPFSGR